MLLACAAMAATRPQSLGLCHAAPRGAAWPRAMPRALHPARVLQQAGRLLIAPGSAAAGAAGPCRPGRRGGAACSAQHRKGEEKGASAVGHDLGWPHVARDIKSRLAAMAGDKKGSMDKLQAWLREADLRQRGESDEEEHSQAEVVAAEEAANQGLEGVALDVQAWLGSPGEGDAELNEKMAGVLVMRLLQAYHKEAGEPFDDEVEDSYWRLQGFVPGSLVEALDHETIKRLVKGYLTLPFSGV